MCLHGRATPNDARSPARGDPRGSQRCRHRRTITRADRLDAAPPRPGRHGQRHLYRLPRPGRDHRAAPGAKPGHLPPEPDQHDLQPPLRPPGAGSASRTRWGPICPSAVTCSAGSSTGHRSPCSSPSPATALAVSLGVIMGIIAGFFGGWADAVIARSMDVFPAFPLLVFAIALAGVVPYPAFGLSGNSLRIVLLIFVIGFFSWPSMGRIIRGQALSLREREFVDAARSLGARGPCILLRELLPNLAAPILVYSTLLIPVNILFEAALSYLGAGIIQPAPSWGGMINDAVSNQYYATDPMFMVIPGLAIFLTVLAFNLFGDGLRDALDPRSSR